MDPTSSYGTFTQLKPRNSSKFANFVWVISLSIIGFLVFTIGFVFPSISYQEIFQSSQLQTTASSKPNIVFILADDQGWNDIGYQSTDLSEFTPFLDEISASGIRLKRYYSQAVCSPSRAALYTGLYPFHNGMQHDVIERFHPWGLDLDFELLPSYLKNEAGYSTHLIGKWHVGHYANDYLPLQRGFDTFYGYYSGYISHFSHLGECSDDYLEENTDLGCFYDIRNMSIPIENKQGIHSMTLFTEATKDLIANHDNSTPFFLMSTTSATHYPLSVPQEILDEYDDLLEKIPNENRKLFGGLLLTLDNYVKDLVTSLQDAGLWDNTILIFASDNGADASVFGSGSNYPLRGLKATLFEGGIKVPAFVYSPLIPTTIQGSEYNELMHVTDWLPTILQGILGIDTIDFSKFDGVSQWDALLGNSDSPRDEIILNIDLLDCNTEYSNMSAAIISKNMKLIAHSYPFPTIPTAITENSTYLFTTGTSYYDFLFDLDTDPHETINLIDQNTEDYEVLYQKLLLATETLYPASYCDYNDFDNAKQVISKLGYISPWLEIDDYVCPQTSDTRSCEQYLEISI